MTGGYDLKPYTSKAKKAIDLAARISKKTAMLEQSTYWLAL